MIRFFLQLMTFGLIFPLWGNSDEMLQQADLNYQKGVKATTFEERKLAFNQALSLYIRVEEKKSVHAPALESAIADTYFQLGEYAWAILYYQRALKEDPHLALATDHLEKAQQKLGLSPAPSTQRNIFFKFFSFLSKQYNLLFWVFLLSFLVISIAIWLSYSWIRRLAASLVLLSSLLIGNFLFFYYFTPIEGILVISTGFYRAPNWDQPQLTELPLLAGSKVRVLQMTSDGNWIKIANSADLVGYIPVANLRLI